MHNSYYYIRHLSREIEEKISGFNLVECFSQQKNELVLIFQRGENNWFILQSHFTPDFSALSFPDHFHKAKRNFLNLFPEIIGRSVIKVKQVKNDRVFIIEFEGGYKLLFKLYGTRSNVILFNENKVIKLFKPKLRKDFEIDLNNLDRELNPHLDDYLKHGLRKTFFTIGKDTERIIENTGFFNLDPTSQFIQIQNLITNFARPEFYLIRVQEVVYLSLIETGEILSTSTSAIEIGNNFFHNYFRYNYLQQLKEKIVFQIDSRIARSEEYARNVTEKAAELESAESPDKIANIIMANLHQIPQGASSVILFDFYQNKDREVKLKMDQTAQKYAESLYKKSKRRHLEIDKLKEAAALKRKLIGDLQLDRKWAEEADSYKALQPLIKKYLGEPSNDEEKAVSKFKQFEYMGYQILVGRNAANNDELTLKFAHKDDLWLHARDVTGSHAVVKHKPGQNFPKPVIEKAASVAAWYSERKTDSLCPVIFTPKKYVRKVKGFPKGAVRVDKEQVVMVVPADI